MLHLQVPQHFPAWLPLQSHPLKQPRTKDLVLGTGSPVNKKGKKFPVLLLFFFPNHLKMFLGTWEQIGK